MISSPKRPNHRENRTPNTKICHRATVRRSNLIPPRPHAEGFSATTELTGDRLVRRDDSTSGASVINPEIHPDSRPVSLIEIIYSMTTANGIERLPPYTTAFYIRMGETTQIVFKCKSPAFTALRPEIPYPCSPCYGKNLLQNVFGMACPPKPGPVLVVIVQLAKSQGQHVSAPSGWDVRQINDHDKGRSMGRASNQSQRLGR